MRLAHRIPTPRWLIFAATAILVGQVVWTVYKFAALWAQNPASVWTAVSVIFGAAVVYVAYVVPIAVMLKYDRHRR